MNTIKKILFTILIKMWYLGKGRKVRYVEVKE